jgi:hypothetical protein
MHADEKNTALSQELGRDVFHYHLHVMYIPIVDKEVYFKKNNKNPELAGKLKEVIHQVSHSKKWARFKDDKGKWVNEYSLLQDRFFEHMKSAGFEGFERGERGSTAEHLDVLDFKIKQDTARAEAVAAAADEKEKEAAVISEKVEQKKKQLDILKDKTAVLKQGAVMFGEIDSMGSKKTILGDIAVSKTDWQTVSGLAKEGIKSRAQIVDLQHKVSSVERDRDYWKKQYNTLFEKVKLFLEALKHAPKRLMDFIADIMRRPPEKAELEHKQERKKIRHEEML